MIAMLAAGVLASCDGSVDAAHRSGSSNGGATATGGAEALNTGGVATGGVRADTGGSAASATCKDAGITTGAWPDGATPLCGGRPCCAPPATDGTCGNGVGDCQEGLLQGGPVFRSTGGDGLCPGGGAKPVYCYDLATIRVPNCKRRSCNNGLGACVPAVLANTYTLVAATFFTSSGDCESNERCGACNTYQGTTHLCD